MRTLFIDTLIRAYALVLDTETKRPPTQAPEHTTTLECSPGPIVAAAFG